MVNRDELERTALKVAGLVRFMYAGHHPGKQLEIDLEQLKLDIMKHAAIKLALKNYVDDGGAK